jgi:L-ascorbate metabolism protein UlaG (beta-lactamase superfamily)
MMSPGTATRSRQYRNSTGLVFLLNLPCVLAATSLTIHAVPTAAQDSRRLLNATLEDGSATIWYLGHAGWAVKTRNHFLIFDYVAGQATHRGRSLDYGFVDPAEIAGQDIIVFVSHGHGDHYDPATVRWADQIEDIDYVFGWDNRACKHSVCLTKPRESRVVDGVAISTVNHAFDGIPEVAFLVTVDGLVIYHSGDHGSVADSLNPIFKENIDYLASLGRSIDVAFLSTFGRIGGGTVNNGDRYTIETLRPKVTFPMHHGDTEDLYERFAREIAKEGLTTEVYYAKRPGDSFRYLNGQIVKH